MPLIDENGEELELSTDIEAQLLRASAAMRMEQALRTMRERRSPLTWVGADFHPPPNPPAHLEPATLSLPEIVWWIENNEPKGYINTLRYAGAAWLINRHELSPKQESRIVQRLLKILKERPEPPLFNSLDFVLVAAFIVMSIRNPMPVNMTVTCLLLFACLRFPSLNRWGRKELWDGCFPLMLRFGGVETIPLLSSALPKRFLRDAHFKLFRLLPQLTSEHYGAFDKETQKNLWGMLIRLPKRLDKAGLQRIEVIAEALEKIGDASLFVSVEAFAIELRERREALELQSGRKAKRGATSDFALDDAQNAYSNAILKAERLLQTLETRHRNDERSRTLLRASAPPDSSDLLRPVAGKQEQDPLEQLLRSADHE